MQKWAHAFRDSSYYAAVDTNNGTESLNKTLKYSYLPKRKSLSLSGIATLLIDHFLPDMNQKYIFENYKLSEDYRSYSDTIPSYLKGRPRSVILHCLQRKLKSHKFSVEDITSLGDGNFEVRKSGTDKMYSLSFYKPECTCKDWSRHHIPCKHFFSVFENFPQWSWEMLPHSYQDSCYLSADSSAVQQYTSHTDESLPTAMDLHSSNELPEVNDPNDVCLPPIPKRQVSFMYCCYCIFV